MFPVRIFRKRRNAENAVREALNPKRLRHSATLLALGLAVALGACTGTLDRHADAPALYWPTPPETPRFAFETALRNPSDLVENNEADRFRRLVAGDADPRPAFEKPFGVAARRGRIYVTDTVTRSVAVFDVPRRRFFHMGLRPPGTLLKPVGIALDGKMRVYVADVSARKVVVYDSLGLYLREIGGEADLERPTGVAVDAAGERVYVVDRSSNESLNHRVVAYDGTGRKLFVIGTRGSAEGRFNVPVQAAVAPDGTLYVLDSGNFRVQAFDRDGRFLRTWGKAGSEFGDFARPRGIAVDGEGNIYVTDAGYGNFQVFNPAGQLLLPVGRRGDSDKPGRYALPGGIAVDETGRVYVVDQYFRKVEVIRRLSAEEGERVVRARR